MRWIASLIVTMMTLAMLGGVGIFMVIEHYGSDLPTLEKLKDYSPPTATRLYAGNGKLLIEYATEKRVFVPLQAIPKRVQQAFISAEDKNFYNHSGVDFFGIMRAALKNVTEGKMEGASTITQQVVKNFLLSRERSYERKIKEALLAFRITKAMPKDKVLELYLNDIFLGWRSYGVAAAALNYFNKSLDELTLEEAAFLAGLPKAPSAYDPRKKYEEAKIRRDYVIGRMLSDGYITKEEAAAAIAEPIKTKSRDETEFAVAAFFAEEVRRKLEAMYGADVLYEGGLVVHTTVDPELQRYARDALRNTIIAYDKRHGFRGALKNVGVANWQQGLVEWQKTVPVLPLIDKQQLAVVLRVGEKEAKIGFANGLDGTITLEGVKWGKTVVNKIADVGIKPGDVIVATPVGEEKAATYELDQIPAVNGAMMVMDPHTGRVLAMVGGYSHLNTNFNRATQAQRQPGSAFKPFVYMAALETGFTPSTIVNDSPIELSQGAGLPMWRPKNYGGDFYGPTTLRRGLENSRNVMTVRLALQVGIDRIVNIGSRFGIYDSLERVFSVVLGSHETTLDKLVNAYAMIVNGGKKMTPALIERIQDRNGKTIFRRDTRECLGCQVKDGTVPVPDDAPPIPVDTREQVTDPRTAYQMVSIMEGVVQRGTAVRAKVLNRPVAGKTGTTNDSRDAWFIGFTPDLVAGVYIGFDNPRKLGNKETGGKAALPAFIEFMQHALKDVPSTPFRVPAGISMTKIDLMTGQAPGYGTPAKNMIFEAFKIDQQPGSMPVLDVSTPSVIGPVENNELSADPETGYVPPPIPVDNSGSTNNPSVTGTGGLY